MRRRTTFQRLALWTTATTYLLILVGGLVRASGAGLGCPDWPRCFGSWIPPSSAAELPPEFDRTQFNPGLMWTEYLNRLLGVTVGFLIFATLVVAIRQHRRTPRILWPTVAAFLLVGFEGWLGGVVVAQELAAWIVTAHLIVALVIVSLLLYATVYAFFGERACVHLSADRHAIVNLIVALIAIMLVQIAFGTQVRGGDERFDMIHRNMALAVGGLAVFALMRVRRMRPREEPLLRSAWLVVGLAAAQILLGVSLVYVGLTPALQIAHLSVASVLLGAEMLMLLLARWLPCE